MEEYPENNCLQTCPLSYYADYNTGACRKCNPACLSCESDKICNSCNKGFYFYREMRTCVSKCPTGFFLPEQSEMCSRCSSLCRTCELRSENCTSCNNGRFFDSITKTCVFKCPDGFYPESSTNICNNCHKTCLTCKGYLENDCLTCDLKTGVRLIKGYCTDKCPGGLIKKKNSEDCIDFNACIESLVFSLPKMFNIQTQNYKASIVLKLKDICNEYLSDIIVMWLLNPDMIVSKDGYSVEIPVEKLKDGNLNMNADLSYNGNVIRSFTGSSILITNKLIPIIKNEAKLDFIYGFEIAIDATLSYDEGSLRTNSKETDNPLTFNWICPEELSPLCKTSNGVLTFIPNDYQPLIPMTTENTNIEVTLNLKKDRRTASKTLSINIRKPQIKNEGKSQEINLADLIVINPLSRGSSPEVVFGVSFLDKNLDALDFSYFWTITHFIKETQYLNSRKEINLKVLNDDLLTGNNEVNIEITDKSGKTFTKTYLYEKGRAPYGGNCVVSPNTGISLKTDFKFTVSGWITKSEPLIYKIKYINDEKNYIDISKGGFAESVWKTNMIPVADDFIVEVNDSSGLSAIATCSLKVKPNIELELLDTYLEKDFDPINRLLLVEIYKSNQKRLTEANNDPSINDRALDMIGYYLNNSGDNIQQDLENIIARLLEISHQNFTKEKLEIVNSTIEAIVDNIEPLLQYIDKMQNVYRILDNIFKKASSTQELKSNKALLEKMQGYLDILDQKLFSNILNGQAVLIQNQNYNTQMNKVSSLNIPDIAISYDSDAQKRSRRNRKSKLSLRSLEIMGKSDNKTNENSCEEEAAICIPKDKVNTIMSNTASKGVGFQGQLNHKSNLPINENQFSNSLNFNVNGEDNTGKRRILSTEELGIRFEIRLKMPEVKDSSKIGEATCVQYQGGKNADTSCESWYDLSTNEVVCSCSKQGLTVNVLDKALSSASKLKQFPSLSSELLNPYSIGIVGSLILFFIVVFSIAILKDHNDGVSLISMRSANYDIIQYYIVKFRKEKFNRSIRFIKLFFYMVKNLHPIIAILNIYDPVYNRKLRVMDFFLMIYLSFFFTLLPFYVTDNSQLLEMASNRTLQNRNKTVNDIEASFKQIIQSMIYSVIASIITFVITTIVDLFFNQDVLLEESVKKRKNMINAIIRMNPSLKATYQVKNRLAFMKIKSILLLSGRYIKKIRNNELSNINESSLYNNSKFADSTNKILLDRLNTIERAIGIKEVKVNKIYEQSNSNLLNSSMKLNSKNANLDELNIHNILVDINNNKQNKNLKEESLALNSDCDIDLDLFKENDVMQLKQANVCINGKAINIRGVVTSENCINSNKVENYESKPTIVKDFPAKKLGFSKIKKGLDNVHSNPYVKNSFVVEKDVNKLSLNETNILQNDSTLLDISKNESKSISSRMLLDKPQKIQSKAKPRDYKNADLTSESFTISLIGKRGFINKPKRMIISVCTRTFIFPTKDNSIFHCEKITISEVSRIDNYIILIKSFIKVIIILTMYFFLWLYIAVFVQSIYKQYGDNVFKICVMPLVSMLLTKLLIVVNFMLLIATLLLYFKGKDYVNNSKNKLFLRLMFNIFVPPEALNHFIGIVIFMEVEKLSV